MSFETAAVLKALSQKYCAPEFALFYEVANGTGSNIRRYADAMAMCLFPSRGLHMHGFEVKVSKGDWKRELQNPHKAEEGNFRFCDHWWIVAPIGIVQPGELPTTWGHIEYTPPTKADGAGSLRVKVQAPALKPEPMTRNFIAAFLRRANEAESRRIENGVREKTRAQDERVAKIMADNAEAIRAGIEEKAQDRSELVKRVKAFEDMTGINLVRSYGGLTEADGRLIKALRAAGLGDTFKSLSGLHHQLTDMAQQMKTHLDAFEALAPATKEKKTK